MSAGVRGDGRARIHAAARAAAGAANRVAVQAARAALACMMSCVVISQWVGGCVTHKKGDLCQHGCINERSPPLPMRVHQHTHLALPDLMPPQPQSLLSSPAFCTRVHLATHPVLPHCHTHLGVDLWVLCAPPQRAHHGVQLLNAWVGRWQVGRTQQAGWSGFASALDYKRVLAFLLHLHPRKQTPFHPAKGHRAAPHPHPTPPPPHPRRLSAAPASPPTVHHFLEVLWIHGIPLGHDGHHALNLLQAGNRCGGG